jgi:acetyl-CoA carboxylase carboxyl transferase subunit beta
MTDLFAKRRARLLALKALRDGQTHPALDNTLAAPCPACGAVASKRELAKSLYVCPQCGHHNPVGAYYRLRLVLDPGTFRELGERIGARDPLNFPGYGEKLDDAQRRTGLTEAAVTATGRLDGRKVAVGVLDGRFLMGSMSAAVGEKVAQLVEYAAKYKLPLILFSASGGARMQEGILSLMQMAKTAAALERFSQKGECTSPCSPTPPPGSDGQLCQPGDVILAEPGALIGFAGPRVIRQTIHQTLPQGFQRAEFLQEHGFVDEVAPGPSCGRPWPVC